MVSTIFSYSHSALLVASTQTVRALQFSSKPVTAKAAAPNLQSPITVRMCRTDVTELQLLWGIFFHDNGAISLC